MGKNGRGARLSLYNGIMKGAKRSLFALSLLASASLPALVEYSGEPPASSQTRSKGRIKKRPRFPLSKFKANFSLGAETVQVSDNQNFWIFDGFLQTPWDFFVTGGYRRAQGEGSNQGNATVLLGFNWLRFGGSQNRVGVDIFGGISLGQKGSRFATSRNDKIFGLKTHKSFYLFNVEMGFQHHLTGTPQAGELPIGDIQNFSLEFSWQTGPDISLSLMGGVISVSPQEGGLDDKMNWGYLSPSLKLKFSSLVGMEVKADFRTNNTTSPEALQARLWGVPGACGNSLKANLSLAF